MEFVTSTTRRPDGPHGTVVFIENNRTVYEYKNYLSYGAMIIKLSSSTFASGGLAVDLVALCVWADYEFCHEIVIITGLYRYEYKIYLMVR